MPYAQTESGRLPFNGSVQVSRHASYQGAEIAAGSFGYKRERYLAFVDARGSVTDEDAEIALGFRRSSICSTRNSLVDEGLIIADGSRRLEREISGRMRRFTHALWRRTTEQERQMVIARQQELRAHE